MHPSGGQAYLALDSADEPFCAGVKFSAMPPTKRFRDMEALSGGEKTVAALALLFAVLRCVEWGLVVGVRGSHAQVWGPVSALASHAWRPASGVLSSPHLHPLPTPSHPALLPPASGPAPSS